MTETLPEISGRRKARNLGIIALWGLGILAIPALIIGGMIWALGGHKSYGDNVMASPEYQECESYLAAIKGVTMHDAIHYCYNLHWGNRPRGGADCADCGAAHRAAGRTRRFGNGI